MRVDEIMRFLSRLEKSTEDPDGLCYSVHVEYQGRGSAHAYVLMAYSSRMYVIYMRCGLFADTVQFHHCWFGI
jgi:hypothetical protein